MRRKSYYLVQALMPLLAGVALTCAADETETDAEMDGATLYTERGCVYCHGPAGKEPVLTEYPKLAGQNKEYLLQQMLDIKSTARKNGYTGMMQPAILSISDEEFAVIAAYLAAL